MSRLCQKVESLLKAGWKGVQKEIRPHLESFGPASPKKGKLSKQKQKGGRDRVLRGELDAPKRKRGG